MSIRRVAISFLLSLRWRPTPAFLRAAALPRLQQSRRHQVDGSRSNAFTICHDERPAGAGQRLSVAGTRTTAPSATGAKQSRCRSSSFTTASGKRSLNAAGSPASRPTATKRRATHDDNEPATSTATETRTCGSDEGDMTRRESRSLVSRGDVTRSQAITSLLSLCFGGAATGLFAEPSRAIAATTDAIASGSPLLYSAGLSVSTSADSSVGDSAASGNDAKYVVGSDEVGVLFGDGPIGIKLGDNPLKATGVCRVYVTEVLTGSQAVRQANLRAGFGVAAVAGKAAAKLEPKEVAELVRVSPRPMEVVFRDPELLGKRLQAEANEKAEAAKRSRRKAAEEKATPGTPSGARNGGSGSSMRSSDELKVTQVGKKPTVCGTKTKAGDLIEFRYSARFANDLAVEFDSSDRRGTGLPYAIVLGNGDVLKGLDLSMFDMCVGERRKVEIPARLAYGRKGSKTFGIPPDDGLGSADVVYGVELVSINFRSEESDKRDNFYTDDPCDAAAIAAGNASGKCEK